MLNPNAFYTGRRYKKYSDTDGDFFKYEIIDNPQYSRYAPVRNLIAHNCVMVIRTEYNLDWHIDNYIVDAYGNKYIINNIVILPSEVAPQSAMFNLVNSNDYYLSLSVAANPLS